MSALSALTTFLCQITPFSITQNNQYKPQNKPKNQKNGRIVSFITIM
jgi:hypothetical protein